MAGKIYAIGDIHGCYDRLKELLDRIPYEPGRDRLVFLGDYIDRGADSARVLDLLCRLREEAHDMVALMGNHEYMLLEYARAKDPSLLPFLRNMGFDATVTSYHKETGFDTRPLSFLPARHMDFLSSLLPYWQTEEYIFVHAGLEPGIPLEKTDPAILCEVREPFITKEFDFGKKVVFGHTPFSLPLVTPTKIGVDTGAAYGNMLTAVELPDEVFYHA